MYISVVLNGGLWFTDACTCPWTSFYDLHLNLIVEYPELACKAAWDWHFDLQWEYTSIYSDTFHG